MKIRMDFSSRSAEMMNECNSYGKRGYFNSGRDDKGSKNNLMGPPRPGLGQQE